MITDVERTFYAIEQTDQVLLRGVKRSYHKSLTKNSVVRDIDNIVTAIAIRNNVPLKDIKNIETYIRDKAIVI